MRVLILGFDNIAEVDKVMMELVEETQHYLFYVLTLRSDSVASQWAEMRGAPLYYIDSSKATVDYLVWAADFLVVKLDDNSPQLYKNLLMKMKAAGKHGRAVR